MWCDAKSGVYVRCWFADARRVIKRSNAGVCFCSGLPSVGRFGRVGAVVRGRIRRAVRKVWDYLCWVRFSIVACSYTLSRN